MMCQPRRKKWSEAEERTLIDKYGEMVCDGTLAKMKTREKKFKPIALHVNSMHHIRNPVVYPWQWTWKDVSTKVQNMRHQYALVKQKIRKVDLVGGGGGGDSGGEEFDWMEGLTYWSNFLRYKEVFGDVAVVFSSGDSMADLGDGDGNGGGFDGTSHGVEIVQFGHLGQGGGGEFDTGIDGEENGVISLEFDYDGEEGEENYEDGRDTNANRAKDGEENKEDGCEKSGKRGKEDGDNGFAYEEAEPIESDIKKRRKVLGEKRAWGFLSYQLKQLKEMETRFEERDAERERERQRKEKVRIEIEQEQERKREERAKEREEREKAREKLTRLRIQEWEKMEKENEERERRREEELAYDREREERINMRRSEWKKRMDEMLSQHRLEMSQMQTRILHEQQNLTSQLLGMVSQWTGHPTPLSDHTGASSHYFSQMMQNMQHVNGLVHVDGRVDGDNQEDQFIVDG